MMATPTNSDRPPDRRREMVDLLEELSDHDLELVLDLAGRLRG
jgi:hypothetical protein